MTPTTRNTLVIGGGLIVIALLLTCGPMSGLFGGGEDATETVALVEAEIETPPVSAAPQVDDAAVAVPPPPPMMHTEAYSSSWCTCPTSPAYAWML